MSAIDLNLQSLLRAAAAVQVAVAVLNLGLVRFLKWKGSLEQLPLLLRQVFMVHLWFISLTVAIFGVMTWRFGAMMAAGSDPACAWLSGAIGFFLGAASCHSNCLLQPKPLAGPHRPHDCEHWLSRCLRWDESRVPAGNGKELASALISRPKPCLNRIPGSPQGCARQKQKSWTERRQTNLPSPSAPNRHT